MTGEQFVMELQVNLNQWENGFDRGDFAVSSVYENTRGRTDRRCMYQVMNLIAEHKFIGKEYLSVVILSGRPRIPGARVRHVDCVICMETKDSGICVPCGHSYHDCCLEQHLNFSNKCPQCRCPIPHSYSTIRKIPIIWKRSTNGLST